MAIVFGNIILSTTKLAVPCGNNFTANVVVNGIENGTGGNYKVQLFDDDGALNPDDLLGEIKNVAVAVGAKRFRKIHSFDLTCNADCVVEGQGAIDSGESCVELYAVARETKPNGARGRSPGTVDVCCIEEEECVVASDDAERDPDDRITLVTQANDNKLVRILFGADAPLSECFADDVDVNIRRVAIGADDLQFGNPVAASWRLSDSESGLFKDFDARIVQFDPDLSKWSSIPFEYTGRFATFSITKGGLYGIARHARFTDVCYATRSVLL